MEAVTAPWKDHSVEVTLDTNGNRGCDHPLEGLLGGGSSVQRW